jgi:hypothetical protein
MRRAALLVALALAASASPMLADFLNVDQEKFGEITLFNANGGARLP